MENGAKEADQIETSAEIAKSAVIEDASPINDLKAEEVPEIVQNSSSEKNLSSNDEESTPAGDTENEPTPVHNEPETMAAGFTGGNPPSAVEEVSKEEKTGDETISAPFDTGIHNDIAGTVGLPASHEQLSFDKDVEFPEKKTEANDMKSTPESVEATSIAENEHVEIPATDEEVTKEENGADAIASTEDDIETEPATADEKSVKGDEVVGEEIRSDSSATLSVEEDEHVDSLAVHEEAPKEETPKEESRETPATVEETGTGERSVEPAIEEELLQGNVAEDTQSKEESSEASSVVHDEKSVSAEADEAGAGESSTEVEPLASGSVSVEATATEEENDLIPGVVNEELTDNEGLADNVTGEANQDLKPAAPHEDVKPAELESAPESIEATPVEDAGNVEPEVLHSEEISVDEATSTNHSAETTSHVEEEGVEVPTFLQESAEKSIVTEESAIPAEHDEGVTPVEDANGTERSSAKDEEALANEVHSVEDLAEATPTVGDKGVEVATPQDEPAKEETTSEVAHSQESVAEEIPSATASEETTPAPEDNDVDVPNPQEEIPQEEAADAAIEEKEVEAPGAHEELAKEETTHEVAQHPEETPLATAPEDTIAPTEDKEEEIVDEISQSREPAADDTPLASSAEDPTPASKDKEGDTFAPAVLAPSEEPAEEETTDEVPQSQYSAVEGTLSGVDPEDVIPAAAEDRNSEAPTSHEELIKDDTGRDDASLVSDSSQGTSVLDDLVEGSAPNDEVPRENTTDEVAQPAEFVESDAKEVQPVTERLVEETADDISQPVESVAATVTEDREPSTGEQEVHSVESTADKIPLLAASDDAVGAVEDKDVDMPTPHEEHAEEESTGEVVQSQKSVADEIPSTTVREDVTPAAEDKEMVVAAFHEEHPKEEIADEIAHSQETVTGEVPTTAEDSNSTAEDKDVDKPVPDEEPAKDEDTIDEVAQLQEPPADEIQSPVLFEGSTPGVEDNEVDGPTTHEEAARDEDTTDEAPEPNASDEAPLIEDEKEAEPVTKDKDLKMEPGAAEEVATASDSAEPIPSVEEKNVEVPISNEEPVKEGTIGDVSNSLDSVQATALGDSNVINAVEGKPGEGAPELVEEVASEDKATEVSSLGLVVESEDVEPPELSIAEGDVEVPGHQEPHAQEDTITRELPVSTGDNREVEPETGTEEHTEGKSSAEVVSPATDSPEPVRAAEVEDQELPTLQKEPEEVTIETAELTPKSEVAATTTPAIEDKGVEFPTQLKLSRELPIADEVPPETTKPAQATAIEAEKEVEPATSDKEFNNSEAAPVTETSMEEASDLTAEPVEIIDKHVLTADSLENRALKTVATETPEAEEPHAKGDKLEEQEILRAEKSNGALTEVVEETDESSNAAATVDSQDEDEVSANQTTSGAKATQGRDLEPGLVRELDQEKVQNVAHQDLEEEDTVSVPLSTHATDLSSSWVNVSSIQSADARSASAGSHSNLSQGSQSRALENDHSSSGGEDWRIVSEQDLGPSKPKDVDTGLSRPKFPFSIVLWCTQSMATLFGGSHR